MATYDARAIALRLTKLGETDMIVTLLSADGRQIRAVAKGMRKPTSRFAGRLQPYSTVDLQLHPGRTLETVTDVRSVDLRPQLREDFDRASAAAVVADVLDKISLEGHIEERLFGLASATLDTIASCACESLPRVVTAFLLKAMAMQGYRPELEACAACAAAPQGSARFSMEAGGVLCARCGDVDASALHAPAAAIGWLSRLLSSTMDEVASIDMPAAAAWDVFAITRAFVAYHLPARLKALDFYAGLVPRV